MADASNPLSRREREVAALVAEGLTDREIAKRLFISERTVEGHLQQIRNKLGFDNRTQVASWVSSRRAEERRPVEDAGERSRRRDNLPVQLTTFIGRERDLSATRRILQSARLLTIVGPGGCGKTRLAIQVATEVLHRYPAGVWFVDLSAVTDPNVVPRAVALALDVDEREGDDPLRGLAMELAAARRRRPVLVVLDNCEHMVARCAATVAALLEASPDVTFLCTGREPLHVPGEALWKLGPLGLPAPAEARSPQEVLQSEAVRLFVDRARASDPEFDLSETNVADVVDLCERLDGIPLALELAAARIGLMGFGQILDHLEERIASVAERGRAGRHQTVRATIGWSYELLSEAERRMFRRLSVFRGGFTLEAADAVCLGEDREGERAAEPPADEPDTLGLMALLADKSLVVPVPPRRERYRCLQLIQRFAHARLRESGELTVMRRRHLDHFLDMVERAAVELTGGSQSRWLERLADEHDNLRAALELSRTEPPALGLRLVLGLNRFWHVRGYLGEGREWTEIALEAARDQAPSPLRARVLIAAGGLAAHQGDVGRARARFEQSLAEWRELDDRAGLQVSLSSLGVVASIQADWEAAHAWYVESLALARELDDERAAGLALCNMGVILTHLDRHMDALAALDEALGIMRRHDDTARVAVVLTNLGTACLRLGRDDEAGAHFRDSLRIMRTLGARQDLAECLEGLAHLEAARGRVEDALRLAGAAAGIRDAIGAPHTPWTRRLLDGWVAAARAGAGAAADGLWEKGRDLGEVGAIALALGETGSV